MFISSCSVTAKHNKRIYTYIFTYLLTYYWAADPQTKPTDLGCESACRLLLSTSTIAIYYSARNLILPFYGE